MARPMKHEKPQDLGGTLRQLFRYLKRHIPLLLLVALLVIVSALPIFSAPICSAPPSPIIFSPAISRA